MTTVVRRLPQRVADRARGLRRGHDSHGRLRIALLSVVRRGGIPASVETFSLADQPDLTFVSAKSLVLEQLYWLGEEGWEPEVLRWWRQRCARSEVIVELGANVGYFTVQGARAAPGARYTAVEPHPSSVAICRAHLDLNGVRNVELIAAAAVADADVTAVEILVPADQLAAPTVAFLPDGGELPLHMRLGALEAIPVPALDIRSLMVGVDVIKLDVEGQEHSLLAAVRDQLLRDLPTLFVELLPGTPVLRAVLADLCQAGGYRCYAPRRDGLVEVPAPRLPTVSVQAEFATNDVILSPHALA